MAHVSLRTKVANAISCLLEIDSYLLEIDVNERTITHRLAMYLQEEFEDWDVDCEYNRYIYQVKQIKVINLAT